MVKSESLAAVRVIDQDCAMVWEINQKSPQSNLLYLSWITSYNISRQANKVSAWLARNARLLSARQVTWISNPSQALFLSTCKRLQRVMLFQLLLLLWLKKKWNLFDWHMYLCYTKDNLPADAMHWRERRDSNYHVSHAAREPCQPIKWGSVHWFMKTPIEKTCKEPCFSLLRWPSIRIKFINFFCCRQRVILLVTKIQDL